MTPPDEMDRPPASTGAGPDHAPLEEEVAGLRGCLAASEAALAAVREARDAVEQRVLAAETRSPMP